MKGITTHSAKETQKVARALVSRLSKFSHRDGAVVIALSGNLGAGKTTFAQGIAKAFGVGDNVLSPTFVLLKIYLTHHTRIRHLIHIDCYRLSGAKDLSHLGFGEHLKDQDALILIEWAERVRRFLPPRTIWVKFSYGKKPSERSITITGPHSFSL